MKIAMVLIGTLFAFNCGRSVSNKDEKTETMAATFANHGDAGSGYNLYSSFVIQDSLLLLFPNSITSVSYSSSLTHPDLTLILNNVSICTYRWNNYQYFKNDSCPNSGYLSSAETMRVEGIPLGETVAFQFGIQR